MKLKELLKNVDQEIAEIDVKAIALDTKDVKEGSLFFCLKGSKCDGHDYAKLAEEKGAVCIVAEHCIDQLCIPCVVVEDTRIALSMASSAFYSHPERQLKIVGITGTNGKTTTAYIVRSILRSSGKKVGMIGTNGVFIDDNIIPSRGMTTPDPTELFYLLRLMANDGVDVVVMEVSAHALELKKVAEIRFTVGAFTNFSQDHLDYFETMEKYALAKLKLFLQSKYVVTNMDDMLGRKISEDQRERAFTYGLINPADVFAVNEEYGFDGIRFIMNVCDDLIEISSSLSGKFNVYNIMCASLICRILGASSEAISEGVRATRRVNGRFNVINTAKYSIIIDFAHTEDGLKNALEAIREFNASRIITVFGCGGDRDKTKRKNMGRVVSTLSDYCIITSDNPRSEEPEQIICDIERGVESKNYATVVDRKQAIRMATEMAEENDIIFIAGKGAERYQEINGVKYEYNDEDYVCSLIERNVIK